MQDISYRLTLSTFQQSGIKLRRHGSRTERLFFIVFFLLVCCMGNAVAASINISSTDVPKSIPATLGETEATSTITISSVPAGCEVITDLNVVIGANHTAVGDLQMTLSHGPSQRIALIFDKPDDPIDPLWICEYDNINVTLDDDAAASVQNQCSQTPPAVSGILKPNSPLSVFNGVSPVGTWQLAVKDLLDYDTGDLVNWSLAISCESASYIPDVKARQYAAAGFFIDPVYFLPISEVSLATINPHGTLVGSTKYTTYDPFSYRTSAFHESPTGQFMMGADIHGIMSGDKKVFAFAAKAFQFDFDPYEYIGINFGISRSAGLTEADLNGSYIAAFIGRDRANGLTFTSRVEYAFDGNGIVIVKLLSHSDDAYQGLINTPVTGAYTVAADGLLTIDIGFEDLLRGVVKEDGKIFVVSDTDILDDRLSSGIGIRKSSGKSNAALSGTHMFVGLGYEMTAQSEESVWADFGRAVSNGAGVITFEPLFDSDNVYTSRQYSYAVAADGTITATVGATTAQGIVSDDGEIFAVVDTEFDGDGRLHFLVGIKRTLLSWEKLLGWTPTAPAAAWNPFTGKTQIVVQGGNNTIWSGTFGADGVFNNDWVNLPGATLAAPALAWNAAAEKMQLVVQSYDNSIWTSTFSSTGAFNNDWEKLPGATLAAPAIAWNTAANKMQLVVRSYDNSIWTSTFKSTGEFNNNWVKLPGAALAEPAIAWNAAASKMQLVVPSHGNSIWTSTFSSTVEFNDDWVMLTGAIPSGPALAWNAVDEKMHLVARGMDDGVWFSTFNAAGEFNYDWDKLTGIIPSGPALVYNASTGKTLLIVRGMDGGIWKTEY